MIFSLKRQACVALGGKNIFSPTTVEKFLKLSDYSPKKDWVEKIQSGQTCHYVTCLETDVSRRRRESFRLLSKLQVQEIVPQVQHKKIRVYSQIQLMLHDGTCLPERSRLEQRVNQLETEIIRLCASPETCPDVADLRRFLTVSVLYGDRHLLYDEATKSAFVVLCRNVH